MNFVLYADGASRGNPGPAAYGAVIYDTAGNVIAELGENLGIRTNNYAEYQAVIAGLRHIEATSPGSNVLVRMDSKLASASFQNRPHPKPYWRQHPLRNSVLWEPTAVQPRDCA